MAATGTNDKLSKTDRSKLKRLRKRGDYDRATVNGLIDEAMMCHVAYVIEGEPYCTPTFVWRQGDHVYWHGSSISRFLQSVRGATRLPDGDPFRRLSVSTLCVSPLSQLPQRHALWQRGAG